jgi:hypothetical protein
MTPTGVSATIRYGEGVVKGKIYIPQFQYDLMLPEDKDEFAPIYKNGIRMYRYKAAPLPLSINETKETDPDPLYDTFVEDVTRVSNWFGTSVLKDFEARPINDLYNLPFTFELDADEEDWSYAQGVVYTVLANFGLHEEFVLEWQFSDLWMLTFTSGLVEENLED